MLPTELFGKARVVHWVLASAVILLLDYGTGPFIQFPILFVVPVALATVTHGRAGGIVIAAVLPLLRLSFFCEVAYSVVLAARGHRYPGRRDYSRWTLVFN